MGQKVHPEAMRVGYIHDWKSNWFSERNFSDFLIEDVRIRDHITNKLAHAGLSDITIRKDAAEVEVNIHTARPGIVIGKSGSEVDALRRDLHRMTGKAIKVNILEIKRPELDAKLVAQSIAEQLQNRVAFRRAMKRALTSAMRSGEGLQDPGRRPPGRRRNGPLGVLLRRPRAAAHAARRHRLRLLRGPYDVRPHRRQVLDQQGRDHARRLRRSGPHLARRARRWPAERDDDRRGGRGRDGRGRGDGRGGGGRGRGGRSAAAAAVAVVARRRSRWPWRRRRRRGGGGGGGRGGGGAAVAVAAVAASAAAAVAVAAEAAAVAAAVAARVAVAAADVRTSAEGSAADAFPQSASSSARCIAGAGMASPGASRRSPSAITA